MSNLGLPDDILHNILVRLPPKSLLRCRCVSKNWNRLISGPYFMKSMIILSLHSDHLYLIDDSVPTIDESHLIARISCLFGHIEGRIYATAVGSFNGIVLLSILHRFRSSTTHTICLYNPLTRASKKLPDPFNYDDAGSYAFGFGYGATPDDLKIVRLAVSNVSRTTCCVFDFKKSSWTTPQDLITKYRLFVSMAGMFLNGFLYWVAAHRNKKKVIVAFNVKEMVFSEIDLPPQCDFTNNNVLGSLKGCLCVTNRVEMEFSVWVMKEQGVQSSWSKEFSLEILLEGDTLPSCVSILDKGRFLMRDKEGNLLIMYDRSKHTRELPLGYDGFHGKLRGIEYVESLVSPSDMCGT